VRERRARARRKRTRSHPPSLGAAFAAGDRILHDRRGRHESLAGRAHERGPLRSGTRVLGGLKDGNLRIQSDDHHRPAAQDTRAATRDECGEAGCVRARGGRKGVRSMTEVRERRARARRKRTRSLPPSLDAAFAAGDQLLRDRRGRHESLAGQAHEHGSLRGGPRVLGGLKVGNLRIQSDDQYWPAARDARAAPRNVRVEAGCDWARGGRTGVGSMTEARERWARAGRKRTRSHPVSLGAAFAAGDRHLRDR